MWEMKSGAMQVVRQVVEMEYPHVLFQAHASASRSPPMSLVLARAQACTCSYSGASARATVAVNLPASSLLSFLHSSYLASFFVCSCELQGEWDHVFDAIKSARARLSHSILSLTILS
jgi:hypothetical protein